MPTQVSAVDVILLASRVATHHRTNDVTNDTDDVSTAVQMVHPTVGSAHSALSQTHSCTSTTHSHMGALCVGHRQQISDSTFNAIWMRNFAFGILRLGASHCGVCTFYFVPHPYNISHPNLSVQLMPGTLGGIYMAVLLLRRIVLIE